MTEAVLVVKEIQNHGETLKDMLIFSGPDFYFVRNKKESGYLLSVYPKVANL